MLEYVHAAFAKGQKYNLWDDQILKNISLKESLFNNYCKEIERLTKYKV